MHKWMEWNLFNLIFVVVSNYYEIMWRGSGVHRKLLGVLTISSPRPYRDYH